MVGIVNVFNLFGWSVKFSILVVVGVVSYFVVYVLVEVDFFFVDVNFFEEEEDVGEEVVEGFVVDEVFFDGLIDCLFFDDCWFGELSVVVEEGEFDVGYFVEVGVFFVVFWVDKVFNFGY